MTIDPGMLFLIFFLLHFGVGLVAYVEKRLKPLLELLRIKSNETVSMLELARHYEQLGVSVPDKLLIEPAPILTSMLRRLEARVSLEISAVLFAALIPSSVMTAIVMY